MFRISWILGSGNVRMSFGRFFFFEHGYSSFSRVFHVFFGARVASVVLELILLNNL